METKRRKILVTSALPYANAPLHMGHILEHVQTDIWVRFQRLRGHECHYVCAADAHGTPIMLSARAEGIAPEALAERVSEDHQRDFAGFQIGHDYYHSTHSDENRRLVERIYARLAEGGHIARRTVTQLYDEAEGIFLPDRYVRGTCPNCGTADQYGDNCENCASTYSPIDLIDPVSVISNTTPVVGESEHLFFRLGDFEDDLKQWMSGGTVHRSVRAKLEEWFDIGLKDWDITREAPYFGFEVPGDPGKYFYVWLDAPVGYMASFQRLCESRGMDFDAWWDAGSETELYHFIGKDIVYFHALFWPAVLAGSGHRTPSGVFAHGFLTINGEKMSKSRGTFINARTYLEHLPAEDLRYYYAAKLGPGIDDIDLNLDDFLQRVNSDLVGKFVNIASRCAGFINKHFDGRLADALPRPELAAKMAGAADTIAAHYEAREFARAMREIMALADAANQYIDEMKPWQLIRDEAAAGDVQAVCTQGLEAFRVLCIYLKPILPDLVTRAEKFLGTGPLSWADAARPLLGTTINAFEPLIRRIDKKAVDGLLTASAERAAKATASRAPSGDAGDTGEESTATIDIDRFMSVDLRVARIDRAELVDGADRLLRLSLDAGELGQRTVFAGIRQAYDPAELEGRHAVLVANLAPRKMKFGTSEGMVLAAGPGGADIFLLSPDQGAEPGMRVK